MRNAEGSPHVQILLKLGEGGELLAAFAPGAWNLADRQPQERLAVCEAVARLQGRLKLVWPPI